MVLGLACCLLLLPLPLFLLEGLVVQQDEEGEEKKESLLAKCGGDSCSSGRTHGGREGGRKKEGRKREGNVNVHSNSKVAR